MKWFVVFASGFLAAQALFMRGPALRTTFRQLAAPSGSDDLSPRRRKRERVAGLFRRLVSRSPGPGPTVASIAVLLEGGTPMKPTEAAVEDAEPIHRTPEELWKQYQTAEAELALNPRDVETQRRCAGALCGWLRLKTDGNTVTIDGPGDTPEFRRLWRTHAPRAVELYKAFLYDEQGGFEPEVSQPLSISLIPFIKMLQHFRSLGHLTSGFVQFHRVLFKREWRQGHRGGGAHGRRRGLFSQREPAQGEARGLQQRFGAHLYGGVLLGRALPRAEPGRSARGGPSSGGVCASEPPQPLLRGARVARVRGRAGRRGGFRDGPRAHRDRDDAV